MNKFKIQLLKKFNRKHTKFNERNQNQKRDITENDQITMYHSNNFVIKLEILMKIIVFL